MTAITWDKVGDRNYESGVDRGVLYLNDGTTAAWNGLISVTEKTVGNEASPIYFDGVKFGDSFSPGEYSGAIKAYTYPEALLRAEGVVESDNGLYLTNQRPERFGLSYRTGVNNDVDGGGYKIHILYNLLATPTQKVYEATLGSDAITFEWNLSAVPKEVPGFRPTAHLIIDTRFMSPTLVDDLENTLYGNEVKNPALPDIASLVSFITDWVILRITDNLDGTWTAEGPDTMIRMLDATTFEITDANAVYLDADTYAITDSTY